MGVRNRTKPCVSRTKWLPASVFGTLSVRCVRRALGHVRLKNNSGVQIALCCIHVVDCCLGRRSCVICKAVIADRSGTAVFRCVWAFGIARNRVFSRTKWLPASMLGTLSVRRVRPALTRVLHCKVQFKRTDRGAMAASMLWIAALVDTDVV